MENKHNYINMQVIEIGGGNLNILEVTEDKIFQVLGRYQKFKPIDKARLKKNVEPFDMFQNLISEKSSG